MIHWHITDQQADQILQTLAQRPFAEVNNLINELMRQANADKDPGKTPQAIAKPNGADTGATA